MLSLPFRILPFFRPHLVSLNSLLTTVGTFPPSSSLCIIMEWQSLYLGKSRAGELWGSGRFPSLQLIRFPTLIIYYRFSLTAHSPPPPIIMTFLKASEKYPVTNQMIGLNITFILYVTTCGGVQIVCLAIWMVFHHSHMSQTAGQNLFFLHGLWVASAEVDFWKVKFTLVQGPLHGKYSPHVLMKVLETYVKFQKNMHLVLRKSLKEIFDIPILEINFK